MFLKKLEWAFRLMRSRTYVLLTDKAAVVNVPLADVNTFENSLLLAGQAASLAEFIRRLEELKSEHEDAIQLIAHRQRHSNSGAPSNAPRRNSTSRAKTSKTTKKK